ncbi:MAG: THUMP domain-containing protein [Promethearchaeota archaeon]
MLTVNDDFNVLLSCRRFQEAESCYELRRTVDEELKTETIEWCKMTGISSLVVARVQGDPHDFVAKLSKVVKQMPWIIRNLLKIQPIDIVVESSMKAIKVGTKELAKRMSKGTKFRVNLNRRDTKLDRDKLLHEVATQFPGKVDLEDYEWICAVEILGPVTGLALIREKDILTMQRP